MTVKKMLIFIIPILLVGTAVTLFYIYDDVIPFIPESAGTEKEWFFALPADAKPVSLPLESLEEINDEKILLTYVIERDLVINALGVNYDVAVIGTNFSFPYVFGLDITYGGFFTKSAEEQRQKFAVLNEAAAFEMFGSSQITDGEIYIQNEKYIVSGVIKDGEDTSIVYVPGIISAGNATELVCLVDEANGVTSDFIVSELKYIGITDSKFDFIYNKDILSSVLDGFKGALNIILNN